MFINHNRGKSVGKQPLSALDICANLNSTSLRTSLILEFLRQIKTTTVVRLP